jgi:hypothetical protein
MSDCSDQDSSESADFFATAVCRHSILAVARLPPTANANENKSAASLQDVVSHAVETGHAEVRPFKLFARFSHLPACYHSFIAHPE